MTTTVVGYQIMVGWIFYVCIAVGMDTICGFNLIKVFPGDVTQMLSQISLTHVTYLHR